MPIYKPSELLQFLESLGIAPRKGLSQNFLIDGNILRKIVETAKVAPGDLVIEVGPGPGSLTEQLLDRGAHVIAVEKDAILAKALERLKRPDNHLEIYCEDILDFPLDKVVKDRKPFKKAKVIANLPYHLTTPIIAMLVPKFEILSSLTLMVQDEVARRFTAIPKTSAYSSFTVFLNFYTNPSYAFTVNSSCFYPQPKVNSAIVTLELKKPPEVKDEKAFFTLTRTSFEHRRKMLRSSLRDLYPPNKIEEALLAIGKSPQSRPEELLLNEFLKLFDLLHH